MMFPSSTTVQDARQSFEVGGKICVQIFGGSYTGVVDFLCFYFSHSVQVIERKEFLV